MKPTSDNADSRLAWGLLAFTIIFLVEAYRYSPQARAFPVAVAWWMLMLLGLDLCSRRETTFGKAVRKRLNPGAAAAHESYSAKKQTVAALWLAAFAAMMALIGILFAVPLYVFAAVRFGGGRSLLASILVAAGTTLTIWLLFVVVLKIELYSGILFGSA